MRFLLDTANVGEIRRFAKTSAIVGVTTNPSLVSKESKRDYVDLLCEIADVLHESVYTVSGKSTERKHLSVEVTTLDPLEMIKQARELYKRVQSGRPHVDMHVKVPVMPQTLEVLSRLRNEDFVKTNATACMTALQAKLAVDAGANVVSFFFNRMIDGGHDRPSTDTSSSADCDRAAARENALMELALYPRGSAPFICGSIRTALDVRDLMIAGADFVTVSSKVLESCLMHAKTEEAINQFQKDIDVWLE